MVGSDSTRKFDLNRKFDLIEIYDCLKMYMVINNRVWSHSVSNYLTGTNFCRTNFHG